MGDVKEILGLTQEKVEQPRTPFERVGKASGRDSAPPSSEKKRKRPTGLSREVAQLTEDIQVLMPSLMPSIRPQPKEESTKQKRVLGKRVWKPFTNSSRNDGLVLNHWAKERDNTPDYPFAKYNRQVRMFEYSDEQYSTYFQSATWTKEETDLLYSMCKQFDLRFIVIHDRWPGGSEGCPYPTRDIEALKERYYSIQRKLIEVSKNPDEDISGNPLVRHPFQADQDRDRKKQYEALYVRNKSEVQEEEMLMNEWARLDKAQKKHIKDSQRILKIVTKRHTKQQQLDEKGGSGAYARSNKLFSQPILPAHKQQKYQPYMATALAQLGIETKAHASATIAAHMIELRNDLILLFEMQRLVLEKNYELEVLKEQINFVNGVSQPVGLLSATSSASAAAAGDSTMDTSTSFPSAPEGRRELTMSDDLFGKGGLGESTSSLVGELLGGGDDAMQIVEDDLPF